MREIGAGRSHIGPRGRSNTKSIECVLPLFYDLLRMFCLFLGLSISFLTAQTVNLKLQRWRFTAAFREWLAIKAILDNSTFLIPW